ncbi:MAG: DUF4282 domain-containing protein [Deltaproteobacteria bacterium]|nr:DUF4282 domain-containing protein [Deltaproteobacteria bacterium]
MSDFWAFRTMVTPVIIQILFWIGAITCLIVGLVSIFSGDHLMTRHVFKGIMIIILGPIVVRIYCEILIVIFRINETLTEIKHAVGQRPPEA